MEHILIIEDDKTISMGLEYYLQQEGFKITVANSFNEVKKLDVNTIINIFYYLFFQHF